MLGLGSDSKRDGRFASIARFVSPFGGAVNTNWNFRINYRTVFYLGIFGTNAVNSSDFPFLALLAKLHFSPQDGRTQTALGRTARISWIDAADVAVEESDYESLQ